jgi:osmotically-inducible protein OsmY
MHTQRHPRLTDDQLRHAVEMGLHANPATAQLAVDVDVMDHRVFLTGHVHDTSDVRRVEQAAAHVADIGEVVDLLDVECS